MSKTLLVALLLAMPAQAQEPEDERQTCARKEQRISEQLLAAEAAGNERQVEGLSEALAAVRRNCSEEGLAADRREKIAKSEVEVAERRDDLTDAMRSGDQEEIKKREEKLAEALNELDAARAE